MEPSTATQATHPFDAMNASLDKLSSKLTPLTTINDTLSSIKNLLATPVVIPRPAQSFEQNGATPGLSQPQSQPQESGHLASIHDTLNALKTDHGTILSNIETLIWSSAPEQRASQFSTLGTKLDAIVTAINESGDSSDQESGGLIAGIKDFIKTGRERERAISELLAATGVKKDSDAYQQILNNNEATASATKFNDTEIFQLSSTLSGRGVSTDNLSAYTNATAHYAQGQGIDTDLAARQITEIAQALNINQNDPQAIIYLTDRLSEIAQTTGIDDRSLHNTTKGLIATDEGKKLDPESALNRVRTLSALGLRNNNAVAAFQNSQQHINSLDTASTQQLKEQGVDVTKPLADILIQLNKAGESLNNTDRTALFEQALGKNLGLHAARKTNEQPRETFEKVLRPVGVEGHAQATSFTAGDNLDGDVEHLTNAVSTLKSTIYDTSNSAIRSLVKGMADTVEGATTWVKENEDVTAILSYTAQAVALAGIVISKSFGLLFIFLEKIPERLSNSLKKIPTILSNFAKKISGIFLNLANKIPGMFLNLVSKIPGLLIRSIQSLFSTLVRIILAPLAAIIVANPIGATIFAIVMTIIAAFGLLYKYVEPFRTAIDSLGESIKSAWGGLLSWGEGLIKDVRDIWDSLPDFSEGPITSLLSLHALIGKLLYENVGFIRHSVDGLISVANSILGFIGQLKSAPGKLWDKITSFSLWGDDEDTEQADNIKKITQQKAANDEQHRPVTANVTPLRPLVAHTPNTPNANIGTINVHAAPGMDEQKLAELVRGEIDGAFQQKATDQRAVMTDAIA